jgi:hypothetical protein
MPDLATAGLGAALAAYLTKDALQKLLGPTADYLGQGLKDFTQRRAENIGRIFQNAEAKLGDRLESPGAIPPKVLKAIVDEGSFSNDELAIEYFGGVLASSRTEHGRDDRGARIAKTLDGLSTYQLRTHYLIYATIRALFRDRGLKLNTEGRLKMQIFIPFSDYYSAMDFSPAERAQIKEMLSHIVFGLDRDGLIDWERYGPQEYLSQSFAWAKEGGIICVPSALGTELFLWAFGHADKPREFIFDPAFSPAIPGIAEQLPNAVATKTPRL